MKVGALLERVLPSVCFSADLSSFVYMRLSNIGLFFNFIFLVPFRELETSFVFILLPIENVLNIKILGIRLGDRV